MEKNLRYDRHARRRMKWRRISEEEIALILSSPDKTEQSTKGRINVYKTIGTRYLKVTYKEFPDEILIISVVGKS